MNNKNDNFLLDSEFNHKGYKNYYVTAYRILTIFWFLYLLWIFYNYFLIKAHLDSPLLPQFSVSYMFSHHAFKGGIITIAILISQIFHWFKLNIISIIILILLFMVLSL